MTHGHACKRIKCAASTLNAPFEAKEPESTQTEESRVLEFANFVVVRYEAEDFGKVKEIDMAKELDKTKEPDKDDESSKLEEPSKIEEPDKAEEPNTTKETDKAEEIGLLVT
ncbi:unnamed protein product [Ilex paraguariensis]|uniref:Uncharacterized protein n=1 Tax=Ilex paraguariensis TaxID=185542 RepID=A0ABC8URJ4_9AQUA